MSEAENRIHELIVRWQDGEQLSVDEQKLVENFLAEDGMSVDEINDWSACAETIQTNHSNEIQPANADFFNSQIEKKIAEENQTIQSKDARQNSENNAPHGFFAKFFANPLLASLAAVMIALIAFVAGRLSGDGKQEDPRLAYLGKTSASSIFIPDGSISATTSRHGENEEILLIDLRGMSPLPRDYDFLIESKELSAVDLDKENEPDEL